MENSSQPEPRRLLLRDVEAHRFSFALSNHVRHLVLHWSSFAQQTIGTQFIRAVDSTSGNLAEGFGRHGKKDKIKFYRIARGSLYEALDWNEQVRTRLLVSEQEYPQILHKLQRLPKSINTLIKITRNFLAE